MNCQEIQTMLHAYGDGELDAMRSLEIEKHLHDCPECRETHRKQTILKTAISGGAPYFKAPEALRRSIIAAARQQAASEVPSMVLLWEWKWSALTAGLAMAACLILGFLAAFQIQQHSTRDLLLSELTASHVRSLLATHLMDVISTDQHTVKPWFDGRLDFAPPVNDLAVRGYPLAGGRLDYVLGRTVAALVYKKQKHFINLFVWPATDAVASPHLSMKNGYNLATWNSGGMTFWAVSDVSQGDLMEFAKLVETGAGVSVSR